MHDDAFTVLFAVESFWEKFTTLHPLGLIRTASKQFRRDTDPVFAVKAMGLDRVVQKTWAQRWLGMVPAWIPPREPVTLLRALETVMAHGGFDATRKRVVAVRAREQRVRQEKAEKKIRDTAAREENELKIEVRRSLRKAELDLLLERENIPREGWLYTTIVVGGMHLDEFDMEHHMIQLRDAEKHRAAGAIRKRERTAEFNARLEAAGLPREGVCYDEFVQSFSYSSVTDSMIADMRFFTQARAHPEYANLMADSLELPKSYMINYVIRTRFHAAFVVDEQTGDIGPARKLRKKK